MKKNRFPIFILTLLSLFVLKDMIFKTGFPDTHDGQNHLARMANYYLGLRQGQVPPRWAPNLEAGLGYTSLNFNYPLANLIAIPLIAVKLNVEVVLKLIYTLAIVSAGLGMYAYLSQRYSKSSALLGAGAYLVAPYQLANIYVRGNIGESLAFGALPWVLFFANKTINSKKYGTHFSISLIALLLSHNLIAVLALAFITTLLLVDGKATNPKRLLPSLGVSLLAVSFFWLPALFEKKFTVLDTSPLNLNQLKLHFPSLDQLFGSAWDHGYSYAFAVDGIPLGLGLIAIFSACIAIPIQIVRKSKNLFENIVLILFFLLIYLMNSNSEFLWNTFPITSIIQFPWRLLFFTTFLSAIITAMIAQYWNKTIIAVIIVVLLFSLSKTSLNINNFHYPNEYWFSFPLNTTILNENDPIWYKRTEALNFIDQHDAIIMTPDSSSTSQITAFNGSRHDYAISLASDSSVIEKTLYFPGWETKVDGKSIDLTETTDRYFGLINFDLKAGEHHVVTKFTQKTPWRIIGNLLSVLGIIGMIYLHKENHAKNH